MRFIPSDKLKAYPLTFIFQGTAIQQTAGAKGVKTEELLGACYFLIFMTAPTLLPCLVRLGPQ